MLQSDIKILDDLLALNLTISIWSARKKMQPDDLGGAELPPEDLATLGSKRVADPEKLKIFSTLKSRAFNYLDRHGVRFMSGWAIPEEKAGTIVNELCAIRAEFVKEKENFLGAYDNSIAEWLARHEDWSEIIRDSIVSPDYVRSRMDFRWQLFKVQPLMAHEDSEAVSESGLAEEVTGLANTLFGEISRSASEIWRKVYKDKTEVTHKALSPLRTLREKLNGLTFIEPHVAPVVEILDASLKRMPPKGNISGPDLLMLQGLVKLLSDSDSLVLHSQKLIDGYGPATVLDSLMAAYASGNYCGQSSKGHEIVQEVKKDAPEIPVVPQVPQLASYGLW